jgi:ribosome biogenesis protein Tsr3
MDVLIFRDPRESAAKCSLTPLRETDGVRFVHDRPGLVLEAGRRILLHPDGDELSSADAAVGEHGGAPPLLLIDCAWRRVGGMLARVRGELVLRRLPPLVTAYPRRSKLEPDPDPASGLAAIEALYAALALLGEPRPELLATYRWRDAFLAANPSLAAASPR